MTLDLLMAVVFVLLFNKMAVAGLQFHEIAGLAICAAFILHIAINWKWVRQVSLKLFSRNLNFKTRLGYIIDLLLLISFAFIIISGVLISKVVFPSLRVSSSIPFQMLHISVSYLTLLLVGIHIGLHWNWAMNVFKKIFRIPQDTKMLRLMARALVVLLLAFGLHNAYSVNYLSKVSSVVSSFSVNQLPGQGNYKGGDMNRVPPTGETGEKPMRGNSANGAQPQMRGESSKGFPSDIKGGNNTSIINILNTYLSIISLFSIATYYIEKLLTMRKLKKLKINK
jgi:hypothetical protein